MTHKYETLDDQCPACGRPNRLCFCHPQGGFFSDLEEKREYQRTHPDGKGRVPLFEISKEEQLLAAIKRARPELSDEELQTFIDKLNSGDFSPQS
jgi:hypothetical protein